MRTLLLLTLTSALALGLMGGCGDDDEDDNGGGGTGGATGGTGGGGTGGGGTGGGGTGGGGTGGTAGGGTGGGGTGGTAGSDGGGAAGADGGGTDGGDAFWAAAYNANCAPTTSAPAGHTPTNQTLDCLVCHTSGGAAASKQFIFGGVVWATAAAAAGAPKIEVGVRDGTNFLYACTDANGFFWVPTGGGNTAPVWANSEIRIRSAAAEKKMNTKAIQTGSCNAAGCHGGALKLVQP